MRIAIFGAGAVGSVIGGMLSTRHDVTLIGREEHVRKIAEEGLTISGLRQAIYRPNARTSVEGLGEQDVVFITTKAYDTGNATCQIADLVGDGTVVVSLQNGLGNAEILSKRFGDRSVVGVPFMGVTYLGPGKVFLAGAGDIVLGSGTGDHDRAGEIARTLADAGIGARTSHDIMSDVWLKAIVNASINPITALVRRENGSILRSEHLIAVSRAACEEGTRAAEANGMAMSGREPFAQVREVLESTAANRSSMLQDVERGKRTEIDEITGALVRAGEAKGVEMPINRTLWALVRSLGGLSKD